MLHFYQIHVLPILIQNNMCIHKCQNYYGSLHMPIGWNGLNMPTKGCSMYMPIVIINFKVRGAKWDSVQYMMMVILTHIPIKCGVVDPNVY